jgi:hypothetical protein
MHSGNVLLAGLVAVFRVLARLAGLKISRLKGCYNEDGLFTNHNDSFRNRADFRAAYGRALQTLIKDPLDETAKAKYSQWNGSYIPRTFGQWRVHIALWCASTSAKLNGDFVECGVFVGFISSAIMKYIDWNRQGKMFFLIDTFEGPDLNQFNKNEIIRGRKEETERVRKIGGHNYSYETVKRNFQEWKNLKLIKGLVPDILKECPAEKVAYLHIDMNCAFPEISALRFFWDKMVPGGIVLLDDYAFSGFEEQHNAMNDLAEELSFSIASLPTGQGLIIKT